MAKAKIIELSEQDLIDVVDRYEYLSTLLENKTIPSIQRLEKLDKEKPNIDDLINELTTTKDFLQNLSTQLTDETKKKIEIYLNTKIVAILKDASKNNETIKNNIDKITYNSMYFKKILQQDEKTLETYKKLLGMKGIVFSSLISIVIGFFIGIAFFIYQKEPLIKIENLKELHRAILDKRIKWEIHTNEKLLLVFNSFVVNEDSFIDDIKLIKLTERTATFYSYRDGERKTFTFHN